MEEERITQCEKDYKNNKCDPDIRKPALEDFCNELEKCLRENYYQNICTSKLCAQLLAEVLNTFVGCLEFKT